MNIQQLRQENKRLKQLHSACEEELEKLKQTGKGHEAEIDTLLKFNERLLGIIENQFNSAAKSRISSDLQIIAETNQNIENANPQLKNKLGGIQPPNLNNNFEENQLACLEDDDDEEEIYNQEKIATPPPATPPPQYAQQPQPNKTAQNTASATARLERVFELHNKEQEVSVNLSNSGQNSMGSSVRHNNSNAPEPSNKHPAGQPSTELQELKEMVKQYKQQFVQNSAQYQQICVIIHNDLLNDLQEFKKIQYQTKQFYQQHMNAVLNLQQEIRSFQPADQLVRVMQQLKVPANTQKLLYQRIINK